ncbi:MAG: 2-oxoglutarate ferredoxin oxidoreductase subunit alpha, partial [Planctomycetota bacterium]|nr:2-oxoglutarate ferredoxin oxidoreductase subunit alpha [Planctomycetota bacterium]
MHRIGGLEKQDGTGNVSYDQANHHHMVETRQKKVDSIADDIPLQEVTGSDDAKVLVVSWGGTFGACTTAVQQIFADGGSVAHAHLRYLNPLPRNLGDLLERHEKVLVPELNLGQLNFILRANFLKETVSLNKVEGRPFTVSELVDKINNLL